MNRRLWVLRLTAILAGIGCLGALEGVLRVWDPSPQGAYTPPKLVYILENGELTGGFLATASPHFVPVGDHIETASEYVVGRGNGYPSGGSMRRERFTPTPEPGTRRYFLLGGSAAVGQHPTNPQVPVHWQPVSLGNTVSALPPELTIAGQLEALLPDTEVINAGMIAQDSSSVRQIAEEVLQYAPDGLILYLGNNEGVGMAYGMQGEEIPVIPEVRSIFRELRLYRLLADYVLLARQGAVSPEVIKAHGTQPHILGQMTLAHWQAAGHPLMDGEQPTDPVYEALLVRFARNIELIVEAAHAQGVQVYVLPTPPHLRYPPFYEGSDPSLSSLHAARYERARARLGQPLMSNDIAATISLSQRILQLDPARASGHYYLGELYAAQDNREDALASLGAALARDVSRKRSLTAYADAIQTVCTDARGCRVVNLHAAMLDEARAAGLIRYSQLFGDHEHLTPEGCAWVAAHAAALITRAPQGDGDG